MRTAVACFLSFVCVFTIGILMLPRTGPTPKPKPLKAPAPVAPRLEFLPGSPSLVVPRIDDSSKQYDEASRLLKEEQYRAAEGAYLQILIRNPHDRKGTAGLIILRRLQAQQDPQKLQEQAAEYRRAIVEERVTDEKYTPREMELLAEASLSAASEIAAEQHARFSESSRISVRPDLTHPAASSPGKKMPDPSAALWHRPPVMAFSKKPGHASRKESVVVMPVSEVHEPRARSIAVARVTVPPNNNKPSSSTGPLSEPTTEPTADSRQQPTPDSVTVGPSGSVVLDAYVLGPGDQIEINVPNLIMTVTITPDGFITLPFIGQIKASGKTVAQLESDLTRRYSWFLKVPSVEVVVRQFHTNHGYAGQ